MKNVTNKKTIIICALLTSILVLCAASAVSLNSFMGELDFNAMVAEKLSDRPEEYFVVTNADPTLLQAISNSGDYVSFHLLDETQMDELIGQHGTSNIEYQSNYYNIRILFVEPSPIYAEEFWMSIFGFVASTVVIVSYAIFKGLSQMRKTMKPKVQVSN